MEIPQEIDDYIRDTIDYSIGLPVPTHTLELKLQASQEALIRLRDQYLYLRSILNQKDQIIDRVRAESSMNAQALKKFVEENQKLANECSNLLSQCSKWERECSLYDHDREALMDFGNEADERAKDAEVRVHVLEEELEKLSQELHFYKNQVGTSTGENTSTEQFLDLLLTTVIGKDEVVAPIAHVFLEENNGLEVCQEMLKMWHSLKPSTHKVLALASEVKILRKEKEHLRINLCRAEEEVKVLDEENSVLEEKNERLMKQVEREKRPRDSSGEKLTSSAPAKGNKRKVNPKASSPIEKKIDFGESDLPRPPLSPLQHNSPESRKMHKKQQLDIFS